MIALIDGDTVACRVAYALEKDPDGEKYVKYNIDNMIKDILFNTSAKDYQVVLSSKTNFRSEIATIIPYKISRVGLKRPTYLTAAKEYLKLVYMAEATEPYEADDVLGIKQYNYFKHGTESILCDDDKDTNMIPGWHYNIRTKQTKHIELVDANRSYWKQVLTGDSTDDIPGIRGMGKVKVSNLLDHITDWDEMEQIVTDQYKAIHLVRLSGSYVPLREKTTNLSPEEVVKEIKQLIWIRRRELPKND